MDATLNSTILVRGASTGLVDERIEKQYQAVMSSLTKHVGQDIALTADEADHVIDFGEITSATFMLIYSTSKISIKLNGAATGVTIGKHFAVYNGAAITSATITELDTLAATVTVVLGS
jgi:hypothetical protein